MEIPNLWIWIGAASALMLMAGHYFLVARLRDIAHMEFAMISGGFAGMLAGFALVKQFHFSPWAVFPMFFFGWLFALMIVHMAVIPLAKRFPATTIRADRTQFGAVPTPWARRLTMFARLFAALSAVIFLAIGIVLLTHWWKPNSSNLLVLWGGLGIYIGGLFAWAAWKRT